MADRDADNPLVSLQAAACAYRIALGPRAGQKALSLRNVAGRDDKVTTGLCADAHGFSLHAGVSCGEHQPKKLERLCRYITRPAFANERRLWRNSDGSLGSHAAVDPWPLWTGLIPVRHDGPPVPAWPERDGARPRLRSRFPTAAAFSP